MSDKQEPITLEKAVNAIKLAAKEIPVSPPLSEGFGAWIDHV